jgi:hypothetical protein
MQGKGYHAIIVLHYSDYTIQVTTRTCERLEQVMNMVNAYLEDIPTKHYSSLATYYYDNEAIYDTARVRD